MLGRSLRILKKGGFLMEKRELGFIPATELSSKIRSKEISPVEVIEAVLERIESINPKINAYCMVASELALEAAKAAEVSVTKGEQLGPLHGIPVSIKDLTPTKGIRTTWGSRLYETFVPDEDDLVVRRLKAAGAIVIGKTNTPEFGAGINATNSLFGTTLNPWDLSRSSGGSSGGAAAALAAGLGPLAQGTDSGGSLRIPASYCGVIGFRTTPGLIPIYPSSWGWDTLTVVGPMARTVSDTAIMLSVMAGPHDLSPISLPQMGVLFAQALRGDCRGMRVAWSPDLGGLCRVEPEVIRICEKAAKKFEELGCHLEEASPDFRDAWEIISHLRTFRTAVLFAHLIGSEELIDNPAFRQNMTLVGKTSLLDVALAERKRTELWSRVCSFFEVYELFLCPSTPTPAFRADQSFPTEVAGEPVKNHYESILLTFALSITGLPVISVPAGWTEEGLPVGIQIIGRRLAEGTVLRAAANFEKIAPWAHLYPPL
jgi:amidase